MDEHTTERGAKPMADGAVVAFSFDDDDAAQTEFCTRLLHVCMRDTLWYEQKHNPAAKWRASPRIYRKDGKVIIRARLVS